MEHDSCSESNCSIFKPFACCLIELLSRFLDQLERASSLLLDLELAIRLAHDPAVVQLAAWAHLIEKRHEVPLAIVDAGAEISQLIHATVSKSVGDL